MRSQKEDHDFVVTATVGPNVENGCVLHPARARSQKEDHELLVTPTLEPKVENGCVLHPARSCVEVKAWSVKRGA